MEKVGTWKVGVFSGGFLAEGKMKINNPGLIAGRNACMVSAFSTNTQAPDCGEACLHFGLLQVHNGLIAELLAKVLLLGLRSMCSQSRVSQGHCLKGRLRGIGQPRVP